MPAHKLGAAMSKPRFRFVGGRWVPVGTSASIAMAIGQLGNQPALANACGVTKAAVSRWVRGHRVSAENAIAIERATHGRVTRSDLRPDLWPSEQTNANHRHAAA